LGAWQATFLNKMGRTVLINSVLDSQLVYLMSSLQLPPRNHLSDGQKKKGFPLVWSKGRQGLTGSMLGGLDSGLQSKRTRWSRRPDIGIQNITLLLKLLHRLHCPSSSAWSQWVQERASLATLQGDVHGDHWHTLRQLLPLYQAITSVDIGNGKSTSFWDDVWLGDEALADRYPLVLSHYNFKRATVSEIIGHGIENYMVPRVSHSARAELRQLSEELHQVNLTNLPYKRQSMFCNQESKLDSGALYKMLKARGQPSSSDSATFIWKSFAPPRVQMFMWLLSQNRLQSRSLLTLKKIMSDPTCEVSGLHEETQTHIFYHCDMATQFWSRLAMDVPSDLSNLLSWNRPAAVA